MKAIVISHIDKIKDSLKKDLIVRLVILFLLAGVSVHSVGGVVYVPSDTTVSLVTFYPGNEIYELEGHSALRITLPDRDVAINYGMFDFDEPNFVYRFVKGETDYRVGELPWALFVHEYESRHRRIVSQELNLTSEQKARLLDLIKVNLLPENRTYRYNYVLDNCATRPLRIVELAIGDSIILPEPSDSINVATFREYMRLYHTNYPWYQFGIDLALGSGIDRQLDAREKSFAPVVLVDQMTGARIGSSDGEPLVGYVQILNNTEPQEAVDSATPWFLSPTFVCWFAAVLICIYFAYSVFRRRIYPRLAAQMVFGIFGLAGLVVSFLVFVSVHEATSPNFNILWLNPLCFVPVVTLAIKRATKLTKVYMAVNILLLAGLFIVWLTGIQSPNPGFVPLVLSDIFISALYLVINRKIEKK